MTRLAFSVCAALAVLGAARECRADDLVRGAVVDRVACATDDHQTYALYLPSAYTPERAWPILYCFDPGARGKVPVERFKAAAETYGYIVVGSNNSRNGIAVRDIANVLWQDTHARFAIDERRTYAAGFSGGARVALALAVGASGHIGGVVACGAGFPPDVTPTKELTFAVFGTAGVDDFNLPEMRRLAEALDAAGMSNRFEVWDGPHDWAPPELCTIAVAWLELRSMRAGTRPKDDALVDAWLRRDEERARRREAEGSVVDAVAAYAALAEDFSGLRDTAAYAAKASQLRGSKEFKDALRAERDDEAKQRKLLGELASNIQLLEDAENRALALQNIHRAVGDLRAKAEKASSPRERRVANRALAEAWVVALQTSGIQSNRRDYARAAATLAVAEEIRPNDPGIIYGVACYYALAGDKKRALDALGRAVASGLADVSLLETDKDLDAVREMPEFKKLVETLRSKRN